MTYAADLGELDDVWSTSFISVRDFPVISHAEPCYGLTTTVPLDPTATNRVPFQATSER